MFPPALINKYYTLNWQEGDTKTFELIVVAVPLCYILHVYKIINCSKMFQWHSDYNQLFNQTYNINIPFNNLFCKH